MTCKRRMIGGCGVLAFILLTASTGCAEPKRKPAPPPLPEPRHSDEDATAGIAMSVSVPAETWEWIATNIGTNSFTINKPINIKDKTGVAISIAAGTTIDIELSGDTGEVQFSKPLPRASRFGIALDVRSLQLKQDGSGLARTAVKDFSFRWADNPKASASADSCECGCGKSGCNCTRDLVSNSAARMATEAEIKRPQAGEVLAKPVVTLYAPEWCNAPACLSMKAAFLKDGKPRTDLPFTIIHKGQEDGVTSFPRLQWTVERNGERSVMFYDHTNWSNLDGMLQHWNGGK